MRKPVTKLPTSSSKGTKMKKYVVPPHRIGVIKSWDSKHTGVVLFTSPKPSLFSGRGRGVIDKASTSMTAL